MRILLVEDSPRLQRSLGSALRKTGYAVDVAGDGEQGLWLAISHDYDVIVLDIMLPKRDGLSVLAELRRQSRAVHVLLLTARDTVLDRVQGLQAGADDYLVKPFALEELLARVQALGRRAAEASISAWGFPWPGLLRRPWVGLSPPRSTRTAAWCSGWPATKCSCPIPAPPTVSDMRF